MYAAFCLVKCDCTNVYSYAREGDGQLSMDTDIKLCTCIITWTFPKQATHSVTYISLAKKSLS